MKILYIANGINGVGGLERVLAIKTNSLIREYDCEIYILTLNETEGDPFYRFNEKVNKISIPFSGNFIIKFIKYVRFIRKTIQNISPDIVDVCDDGLKAFCVPFLFWKRRHALVYERHTPQIMATGGEKPNLKYRLMFKLMRKLANGFDRFVLLSLGHKKEWDNDNVVIIPNIKSFHVKEIAPLNTKRIIAVGKISEVKAYEYLARAWALVAEQCPDWEVHIFGEEHDSGKLRKLIQSEGIPRLIIQGNSQDIMKEFQVSSIHVMTSLFEGLPMAIIEAQSSGVPTISFDCPYGPADIITDGLDGFLIPVGNIKLLAEKMLMLTQNGELRKSMGIQAYKSSERYSVEKLTAQWYSLFTDILVK